MLLMNTLKGYTMKTKQITTSKGEFLIADIPEVIPLDNKKEYYHIEDMHKWKGIGFIKDLTEEQASEIMEYKPFEGYRGADEYYYNPIDALLSVLVSEKLNVYSNLYIFKLIE